MTGWGVPRGPGEGDVGGVEDDDWGVPGLEARGCNEDHMSFWNRTHCPTAKMLTFLNR